MRTSITLDEEVYEIASSYAAAQKITLGGAIGELVRKAVSPPQSPSSPTITRGPHGFPIFVSGIKDRIITTEMVKAAQEDDID